MKSVAENNIYPQTIDFILMKQCSKYQLEKCTDRGRQSKINLW
jgi:hypothetical protein